MLVLSLFSPFSLAKNRMVTIDLSVTHTAELNYGMLQYRMDFIYSLWKAA